LADWLEGRHDWQGEAPSPEYLDKGKTFLARLQNMPPLIEQSLWPSQIRAITNLEQSLRENRARALFQMDNGSGKILTSISFICRLIKFAGARRVLFLVDRSNLGDQTLHRVAGSAMDGAQQYFDAYLIGLTATPNKAAQIRLSHQDPAQGQWPGRRGSARQRAVLR
jgi:type I site-specific restriction endonuclease